MCRDKLMEGTGSRCAATLGTTTKRQWVHITLCGLARDNSRATTGSPSRAVPVRHARCDPVRHARTGRSQAMSGSHPRGQGDRARAACAGCTWTACAGRQPAGHARILSTR
ncbi:hypothetical protein PanWU01x14_307910 [Parasponia andersonii]|uniref:Uncharacterized protein n=1 Tax=Parasponia andersonii TaxID=3476 RepID=A0A2P5ARE2_PARAD|nr:hypothetical protein PanWU01x14_307910 [Parasponia andersonii]